MEPFNRRAVGGPQGQWPQASNFQRRCSAQGCFPAAGRIQAKLDEIIRSSAARNSFVGIDHLAPDELEDIRTRCEARARAAAKSEKAVEVAG
jgi:low affinity Fe/Cu permease